MTVPTPAERAPTSARPTRRLFLLAQGFVWLWFANAATVILVGPIGLAPRNTAFPIALLEAAHGLVGTLVLEELYARRARDARSRDLLPLMLLASALGGAWWAVSMGGITSLVWGDAFAAGRLTIAPLVQQSWLWRKVWLFHGFAATGTMLLWSLGWLMIRIRRDARATAAQASTLLARLTDARLAALRYQVNPHFLFNTLTALHGLIAEEPVKAQATIRALATYLRYTLVPSDGRDDGAQLVPLSAEVEALRNYLAVESARFEAGLQVRWSVDPEAEGFLVPPLLLQPLVENAVRHGAPDGQGVQHIAISAALVARTLHAEVESSGPWKASGEQTSGIGLANVRERLALAFPERHTLSVDTEGHRVRVTVKLVGA